MTQRVVHHTIISYQDGWTRSFYHAKLGISASGRTLRLLRVLGELLADLIFQRLFREFSKSWASADDR